MLISPPPNQTQSLGDAYLKLQLDRQTVAVLPIEQAQQTLIVSAQRITPIPNMPDPAIGLLNLRSRVFWVINLPQMLGLQALAIDSQQYQIVIIQVNNISLGLVVQEIQGITRLTADSIQSPIANVASDLVPYLQGYVLRQTECLLVLATEAIVNSPILHRNH